MAEAQVTTTVLNGDTILNVVPNDSTRITLNTKDTYMDKNIVINIEGAEVEDTKVTQTASTAAGALPVLIAKTSATNTDTTYFDTDVTIDPGTGALNSVQYELPQKAVVVTETTSGGWLWR